MGWVTAIELMSGTSYDGVDVTLVETDGEQIARLGPTGYRAYRAGERELIRQRPVCRVRLEAELSCARAERHNQAALGLRSIFRRLSR